MSAAPTGLDRALSLETVYYSSPVPRDLAVLNILGVVFDKVYFPGVYLPKDGFDLGELDKEITQLEGVDRRSRNRDEVLGLLKFARYAKTVDGFCEFTGSRERLMERHPDDVSQEALKDLYTAIHGPLKEGWEPMFDRGVVKQLPGSDEVVAYPGTYNYLARAIKDANRRGVPLINDLPGFPIPGVEGPSTDVVALSGMLAIKAAMLALPEVPLLPPEEVMEFRSLGATSLRSFRVAIAKYAASLNKAINDVAPADFEQATKAFVQFEIVPTLASLQADFTNPARPWYRRATDFGTVSAGVGMGFFTLPPMTAIASALAGLVGLFALEVKSEGEHRAELKRSGLYYLLEMQRFYERRVR